MLPAICDVPVTDRVGVDAPERTIELTEVGVIAPSVKLIAGVVVAVATVPDIPFIVTIETIVTVPPLPVALNVVPENESPDPNVISDILAVPPVGFPKRVTVDACCIFAYVTLLFPMVVVIAVVPLPEISPDNVIL